MKRLSLIAISALIPMMVGGPAAARAESPSYESSTPARNERVSNPPSEVRVRFSEALDPRSSLAVYDECGNRIDDEQTLVVADEMRVGIRLAPRGTWKVDFTATGLAGLSGTNEGTFTFTVTSGPECVHPPGHGNHGGNHGNHGNQGNHGGNHNGHDDHQKGHSSHGDHRSAGGSGHSDHSGHTTLASHFGSHGDHGDGHGKHAHHKSSKPAKGGGEERGSDVVVAAGPLDSVIPGTGGGAAVLALLLAAVLGALGGVYLRLNGLT